MVVRSNCAARTPATAASVPRTSGRPVLSAPSTSSTMRSGPGQHQRLHAGDRAVEAQPHLTFGDLDRAQTRGGGGQRGAEQRTEQQDDGNPLAGPARSRRSASSAKRLADRPELRKCDETDHGRRRAPGECDGGPISHSRHAARLADAVNAAFTMSDRPHRRGRAGAMGRRHPLPFTIKVAKPTASGPSVHARRTGAPPRFVRAGAVSPFAFVCGSVLAPHGPVRLLRLCRSRPLPRYLPSRPGPWPTRRPPALIPSARPDATHPSTPRIAPAGRKPASARSHNIGRAPAIGGAPARRPHNGNAHVDRRAASGRNPCRGHAR